MKKWRLAVCFIVLFFASRAALAANSNDDMLPLFKEMVAEDKARFGIDTKKCRLECGRVYSESHCISKCEEIANKQRAEGLERERVEKEQMEEQKPLKYKEAAEKYR